MYNYEQEICDHIERCYPEFYLKKSNLPKPFKGTKEIKVIVLGADPTFTTNTPEYDYVYDLNNPNSSYSKDVINNLAELNLGIENIYSQYVVRNFFATETITNTIWKECALLWLGLLKEELDNQFDRNIPVFVTAWKIFQVVSGFSVKKNLTGQSIYYDEVILNENENFFGRKLIAFFNQNVYRLSNWPDYKAAIKNLLQKL